MVSKRRPSPSPSGTALPVEIFSVQPGTATFYRFLDNLQGLNTHWNGKRTVPCDGEGTCPASLHRGRTIFKAYAPAELWKPAERHWLPGVLEATEALEEQLRGRQLRGEVWMLKRGGEGRKDDPVFGVYSETYNGENLRPAFDIVPVLLRFYHVPRLVLGVENALPAKLLLDPAQGDQPKLPFILEPSDPPRPDQEEIDRLKALSGKMAERFKATAQADTAARNGKH